ncbi:MAG: Histidine--tRNA ligase [Syntrophaceae bacterium PtaU1.Bin231]|nr:MAG: Histidine--tRNA ligase [Syntrophaceae bacterium PtaU1.Bin231]
MEKLTAVRGFKDILPEETGRWRQVEQTAHEVFKSFGFREIRVPILEKTDLFVRGIGETTDIVEKEMYTFSDKGEESLTLRPEATASVVRAYLEHGLFHESVSKLYTMGPMFRRERPQKGRFRQFHQIDVEHLGTEHPRIDAEIMLMLVHYLQRLGLQALSLEINSLGCAACRPDFKKAVVAFFAGREAGLCADCTRRLRTNPLRIFDCKTEACRQITADAPKLSDHLCAPCREHFDAVRKSLDIFALPYRINERMVRGLDYYCRTAFEITTEHLGAQNAVAGGGRYDGLVRDLGGPDIPGIGFAIGMERLISLLPDQDDGPGRSLDLFVAAIGEKAQEVAYGICNRLRMRGLSVEMEIGGKSLKSQMKRADRLGCRYTLILGENELAQGSAGLRDMKSAAQSSVPLPGIEDTVTDHLRAR